MSVLSKNTNEKELRYINIYLVGYKALDETLEINILCIFSKTILDARKRIFAQCK